MTDAYTPLQAWVTQHLIKVPDVIRRGKSSLTDYDPVHSGNVIPGEVEISDPGQIGRSNLPSLHTSRQVRDEHQNPFVPAVDSLTSAIPRVANWAGLRGSSYQFTYTNFPDYTYEYEASAGVGQQPFGLVGTGGIESMPYEHGPISIDELEQKKGVRQPNRLRQRSWLSRLLFLPGKDLDPTGSRDERVLPAAGREDKDIDRLSDASVGTGIQFVIPDIHRTFDNPKDVPNAPVDAQGNPIIRKSGYCLTATALEALPHDVVTSHAYPNYVCLTETPIGSSADRVRAGVQYDLASVRPAVQPHWYDHRGYDQLIAQHDYALKGQLKPPSASRPVMANRDDQSDVPWIAGSRRTFPPAGMNPVGVQPNIDRQQPQSWDSAAYLVPTGTIDDRASAWRLS